MAAAYQTGTASSPSNLLQSLVTWLTAQGWTVDASAAEGAGWRAHLHKGGLYVSLRAAMNETIWSNEITSQVGYGIGLYLGTGYSGAAAWDAQAGGPDTLVPLTGGKKVGCGINLFSGAIAAYHFFDDGLDNIAVIVEKSPGLFVNMGWGTTLTKVGFSSDYPYFYASTPAKYNVTAQANWPAGNFAGLGTNAVAPMAHSFYESTYIEVSATAFWKVDAAIYGPQWISNAYDPAGNDKRTGWTGRTGRCALNYAGINLDDGKFPNYTKLINTRVHQTAYVGALLLPLYVFTLTDPGARFVTCGYAPSVFYSMAFANGFPAGSIWQVGGVDYMVFPYLAVKKLA